ncbi:hypothetical protein Shyhy01_75250 [Streptomyces hygroscopicus subsp. hygroscopicus]|nr:hypothetical protein Shyhy01_75250 [Streptomyces hygroscopicus subsp. hygroscopicus]
MGPVEAAGATECLALESGVERLGECVVRARADRSHGLSHAQLGADIGELPRVAAAARSASATSEVRMRSATDQPTRRREKQSITVARYRTRRHPPAGR